MKEEEKTLEGIENTLEGIQEELSGIREFLEKKQERRPARMVEKGAEEAKVKLSELGRKLMQGMTTGIRESLRTTRKTIKRFEKLLEEE